MGPVRTLAVGAWVLQGRLFPGILAASTESACASPDLGVTVWDLFYVGLTIVVFAVLLLILKGVERFER
jgi:hypothetical protein